MVAFSRPSAGEGTWEFHNEIQRETGRCVYCEDPFLGFRSLSLSLFHVHFIAVSALWYVKADGTLHLACAYGERGRWKVGVWVPQCFFFFFPPALLLSRAFFLFLSFLLPPSEAAEGGGGSWRAPRPPASSITQIFSPSRWNDVSPDCVDKWPCFSSVV